MVMRSILVIAKISVLENARKQVFQTVCLLMLAVIAGSTLLSVITDGVKIKILKDLCMSCILFAGAAFSITLACSGIPNDVERRTIHPLIARPIARWHYVVGKFLGAFATVAAGVLLLTTAFAALLMTFEGKIDPFLWVAVAFALLETAVICAVATALSTCVSASVAAAGSFLVYLFGSIKIGYAAGLIDRLPNAVTKTLAGLVCHALPNLECFNLKTALVHHDPVPIAYLGQVAVYGFAYAAFVLFVSALSFSRKEV